MPRARHCRHSWGDYAGHWFLRGAGDEGAGLCTHNPSPGLSWEVGFWLLGSRKWWRRVFRDRTPDGTRAAAGTRRPVAEVWR